MPCPDCQGGNVVVVETRVESGTVERRRKCRDCGSVWHTVEVPRHRYERLMVTALSVEKTMPCNANPSTVQ